MDIQDFLIQGEGSIEDKKEAWNYFQKAYEHQMKGELEEAVNMYKRSIESHPTAEAYTFLGWTYILVASGLNYILAGVGLLVLGVLAYLWRARGTGEWPFQATEAGA